jgi:hypothetical protein
MDKFIREYFTTGDRLATINFDNECDIVHNFLGFSHKQEIISHLDQMRTRRDSTDIKKALLGIERMAPNFRNDVPNHAFLFSDGFDNDAMLTVSY